MKRTISIIVTLLAICTVSTTYAYSGGNGTSADPYQVADPADLVQFAGDTASYDKYFILTADIDLTGLGDNPDGTFSTAPIAPDTDNVSNDFQGTVFSGSFDGGGFTISNLTIDTKAADNCYLGLFGNIAGGTVSDLKLENVSITGGGLSDFVGSLAGVSSSVISDCHCHAAVTANAVVGGLVGCSDSGVVTNSDSAGTVGGYVILGGLVGWNCGAIIIDSHSTVTVSGQDDSQVLGGLAGKNTSDGDIFNCYSTGAVTGSKDVGGLIGWNLEGIVAYCYSTSAVTGSEDVGGLIGWNCSGTTDCYATGDVAGSKWVGGLVGSNTIGGLIVKCYAAGEVTGQTDIGGLAGETSLSAVILNSFWNWQTTGMFFGYNIPRESPEAIINVAGKTTPKMKTEVTFTDAGWDFDFTDGDTAHWRMRTDISGYPKLSWQFPKGDFNADMSVDSVDLSLFAAHWLTDDISPDWSLLYNLDDTGSSQNRIDLGDLLVLVRYW